ncbi:cell division protein FtsL [Alginatibacterium sediminis]|uniref:Cell division protein FtsL n=1 Tax=Alginatibacterium sediminis TaxID=2164068 RepID=A0A420E944_9ALTE|nr:cell division protein FtsL [Alginatibacterium sediminis]
METSGRQPQLLKVIVSDLWRQRIAVSLLLMILASAFAVVLTTHNTRMLISQREDLQMLRDELNVEWRHLLIEQNALAEHSRVERLAVAELNMKRPNLSDEVMVRKP